MNTPSLISIILNNPLILALGVGIGVAYAVIYHYYHRTIKHDTAGPVSLNPIKDLLFTVIVIGIILAIDQIYALFMSSLLGINMAPGDHVRLAEGLADRSYQEIKSTLYWSYLGEFVFSFFASMQFSFKIDLTPGLLSKAKSLPFIGKTFSALMKRFLSKVPGSNSLSKGLVGSSDIGTLGILLQPFSGVLSLWRVMEKASMFLFLMVFAYFLQYSAITMIIPLSAIFLPFGLFLMFIPPLRKTGSSIIALILTMYFIFPTVYIYMDGVFRSIQWYDANRLFSFLSPTLLGIAMSDPTYQTANPEYSSFLMREIGYSPLLTNKKNLSLDVNTSDVNALVNYIQYEQVCAGPSDCVNIKNQKIDNETALKGVYQDFRSPNVVAPWMSFLGKTTTTLGELWILRTVGNILNSAEVQTISTFLGPVSMLVIWFLKLGVSFLNVLFILLMALPVNPDNPIISALIPAFLPFYFFKSTMIFIIYVAQYALIFATSLFFQIFLTVSAYRSIAIIIGGEPSLPGLDKVI